MSAALPIPLFAKPVAADDPAAASHAGSTGRRPLAPVKTDSRSDDRDFSRSLEAFTRTRTTWPDDPSPLSARSAGDSDPQSETRYAEAPEVSDRKPNPAANALSNEAADPAAANASSVEQALLPGPGHAGKATIDSNAVAQNGFEGGLYAQKSSTRSAGDQAGGTQSPDQSALDPAAENTASKALPRPIPTPPKSPLQDVASGKPGLPAAADTSHPGNPGNGSPETRLTLEPPGHSVKAEPIAAATRAGGHDDSGLTPSSAMEGKPGEAAGAVKRALAGMDGAKVSRMMPRSEERGRETKAGMQTLPGPGRALPSSSGDSAAGWNARTLGGDNSTQLSNAATPAFGRVSAPDRFQAHAELPSPNSPWDVQGQKPWVREAALGVTAVKDDAVESATKSLAQEILHSAVRFRSIRAESMSVVLRPDGQTELTLQLTLHQGRIEVEARVQRGDWTTLQAQWAQLQQTLSQQGVRLNALAADASIMTASGGADDRLASPDTPEDRRTPEEQEERSPLRANHERGNGDRPRRTAAAPTKGSWETWA